MSIEIRQMVVKSSVVQRSETVDETDADAAARQAILEECKRLIDEALQEMKER